MDCVAGSSNRPEEEKKEEKKLVCLNLSTMFDGVGEQTVWFSFDPLQPQKHDDLRPIWTPKSKDMHPRMCSEACGTKLYMFGGVGEYDESVRDYETSDEIVFFDATNITQQLYRKKKLWNRHSTRMCSPRWMPIAITVEKKIYLFGGDLAEPWGEVFDTESGVCSPIPDPPIPPAGRDYIKDWPDIHCAAVHNKRILLAADHLTHIYSYDTQLECLEFHPNHPLVSTAIVEMSFRNAVVDDLLYAYNDMGVYVYNFSKDVWYKSPVQGLFQDLTDSHLETSEGFVFHLGNKKLCVAFFSTTPATHNHEEYIGFQILERKLHCATFVPLADTPLQKSNEETIVKAKVLSYALYHVTTRHFVEALLVDGGTDGSPSG